MNLKSHYLGFELDHPIVPSAGPLTSTLSGMRQLEDAGAPMVIMSSLFEEQILRESSEGEALPRGAPSRSPITLEEGETNYLERIRSAREALSIPIVASLNGVDSGRWVDACRRIEEAGAHAIELNVYYLAVDMNEESPFVENRYFRILEAVKAAVDIPIAMKIPPYFSSPAFLCRRLDERGASGLVLFNRFYQPEIDIEQMTIEPSLTLSTPADLNLPLRWIAFLHGRTQADLALSSGVHRVEDVVKGLMVGACVTHTTSALLLHGPEHLTSLRDGLGRWLEDHGYESVAGIRGVLDASSCFDPGALARTGYLTTVRTAVSGGTAPDAGD